MSLPRRPSRLRRVGGTELLIGAATVILSAVLVAEHRYTTETLDSARSWSTSSTALRVRISESRLSVDDWLAGDPRADLTRRALVELDQAGAHCRALVEGGSTEFGRVEPLPSGKARTATTTACREIRSLRAGVIGGLRAGGQAGARAAERSYDTSFTRILDLSRAAERAAARHVEDRKSLAGQVKAATIAALLVLLGAVLVMVRRSRRRIGRLASRYELILNAAGDGIYGEDSEGRMTFVNPAAARMTGYGVEELVGQRAHELIHHTRPDGTPYPIEECEASAAIRAGRIHHSDEDVYWRKDGTSFAVEFTSTPIFEGGEVTGAVVIFKDVSERKDAEELVERQRRQLAEAQAVGSVGSWEWDIVADRVEWSDELCRIYGLPPGHQPENLEEAVQFTHPDDRPRVEAFVQQAIETGEPFSFDYRLLRADGEVRMARANGRLITDDDGTPLRMLGTAQDIHERHAAERAKEEFTSIVSHELRTPLTSIRGSLGLLASGVLGPLPEQGKRMVEIAVDNSDRLVRLINDILDVERIDSGTIGMQRERCDAAELVERAIEGVNQLAADAQVELVTEAEPAALHADPDRVHQTLINLLANAIKFSPANTTVRVSCGRREGEVLFQVSDQGRGIPADRLDAIFARFQQVDASDSREKGGTGLGLAICRAIVEQHGGRIWAESELGAGSTFSFVLPAPAEQAPPAPSSDDGRPTVLVCDDDPSILEVIEAMLERNGYRAITARSGEEAIELAASEHPAVLLLDLLMPGMGGWKTAATVEEQSAFDRIPIVILSALSEAESKPVEADVVEWVEKPFEPGALIRAIQHAIDTRGEESTRVLVVEDDDDLASVLCTMFRARGLEIFRAASGREAIRLSQQVLPQLLVLDLGLPEADGFEVVDWLRQHDRLHAVPIVVYTGRDLSEEERERLRLGDATIFLSKSAAAPEVFEKRVLELLGRITENGKNGGR